MKQDFLIAASTSQYGKHINSMVLSDGNHYERFVKEPYGSRIKMCTIGFMNIYEYDFLIIKHFLAKLAESELIEK